MTDCVPRFATPRRPERKTLGDRAARYAAALDTPLMPWQRQVLDVALEIDPDTGRFAYRNVGVTVPRQALALNTPILTTEGWSTMGELATGDFVYGPDGQPTPVLGTSEVFNGHPCYEVEFTDGSVVVADADHLWRVWCKDAVGGGRWETRTTEHLVTRFGFRRPGNGRMEYRYRVMCDVVIQTPEALLPVDPYVLGYWLGDGTSSCGVVTCADEDQSELYEALGKAGYSPHPLSHHHSVGTYGLLTDLRAAGVLNNKHIPPEYLMASPAQRRALLAGLLDSDGSIGGTHHKTPRVEFSVCSERLAQDVHRLARSLGQRAVIRPNKAVLKRSGQGDYVTTRYRVTWTPTENPFRLARKASRWQAPVSDRQKWVSIIDVRPVPSVPTRCIQVAHPEHLYLAGDKFIPTHNSGKTTMIQVLTLLRGLSMPRQNMRYTAQTSVDARKKVFDDWMPDLTSGQFAHLIRFRLANGHEQLQFKGGSTLGLVATTKKSGHGGTIDLAILDEAFAHTDARLEQALSPAMITRPEPQMWVISTAGTPTESPFLLRKVEQGRQHVKDGVDIGTCYFEWSAEDDEDPASVDVWRKCMPALGHTITEDAIRAEYVSMDLSEFRRAYLNQWVTAMTEPVIPLDTWKALADLQSVPEGSFALAIDVSEDRKWASIAIAGRRADGRWHVEVAYHEPGTSWVAERVAGIWHGKRPVGIYLDRNGPAGSLVAELKLLNVPQIRDMPPADLARACGTFYDACMDGSLVHRNQKLLHDALEGAVKKPMADAWAWSRRKSDLDISPLVAATFALYGMKEHARAPEVWSIRDIIEQKKGDTATPATPATPEVPAQQHHPAPGGQQFTPL